MVAVGLVISTLPPAVVYIPTVFLPVLSKLIPFSKFILEPLSFA